MHLPWWFLLLSMLTLTVPITSLALVGTGTGWFISRRKRRFGLARLFAWCTVAIVPFWLAGAGFGMWMISGMMAEDAERARLNYKLREATVIDGVDIPAGVMTRRRHKLDTEPAGVEHHVAEGVCFDLAAVAAAGADLTEPQ